jgi:hypothetical protein
MFNGVAVDVFTGPGFGAGIAGAIALVTAVLRALLLPFEIVID